MLKQCENKFFRFKNMNPLVRNKDYWKHGCSAFHFENFLILKNTSGGCFFKFSNLVTKILFYSKEGRGSDILCREFVLTNVVILWGYNPSSEVRYISFILGSGTFCNSWKRILPWNIRSSKKNSILELQQT